MQCNCPEGFSGPVCEQTSCIPIKTEGDCDRSQSSWYFDSYSNMCKPTDTGKFFLNIVNNFLKHVWNYIFTKEKKIPDHKILLVKVNKLYYPIIEFILNIC